VPTGTDQCFNLAGASTPTPPGLPAAVGESVSWDGPAVQLGPRIYVPVGSFSSGQDQVGCFDYSTGASCPNFPKHFSNLNILYTVNPDFQRPTCLWVNSDTGSAQIQSFDAYSGGACGRGAIRVLASQFIVPQQNCMPNTYRTLQVISPAPGTYTDGSVEFDDGAGNPIPGLPTKTLDATGSVDLTGLALNTATGLPQFLITLNGAPANTGQVVVKLVWSAAFDPACVGGGQTVQKEDTAVATSLSGGGNSGASITVPSGTPVTDTATITGNNASGASGTVNCAWYSESTCAPGSLVFQGANLPITTPGTIPDSEPVNLPDGTYYPVVTYSGDAGNNGSSAGCGSEILTVGTVVTTTALGDKQQALALVQAMIPGASREDAKKLTEAAKSISDSINDPAWIDPNHLTSKDGNHVFDKEKQAVDKLTKVSGTGPAVDLLIAADNLLAMTAVNDAIAGGGDPKKIAEAEKQLAKAEEELSKGHAGPAIDRYKDAWHKALEALKKA